MQSLALGANDADWSNSLYLVTASDIDWIEKVTCATFSFIGKSIFGPNLNAIDHANKPLRSHLRSRRTTRRPPPAPPKRCDWASFLASAVSSSNLAFASSTDCRSAAGRWGRPLGPAVRRPAGSAKSKLGWGTLGREALIGVASCTGSAAHPAGPAADREGGLVRALLARLALATGSA